MATSRIEEVKPPQDAASALSQILRGLLNSSSRSTKLERVVVVGDLRVDTRELVDLEFDLVAISKSSRRHSGQIECAARREQNRGSCGSGKDARHGCCSAAAASTRAVVLGAALRPRASRTRVGLGSQLSRLRRSLSARASLTGGRRLRRTS